MIKTITQFTGLILLFAALLTAGESKIDSLNLALLTASPEMKPEICNQLAELYLDKHPDKSVKYGKHVITLDHKSREQLAAANFNIGEGYENLSNYSQSIEYYHEALKLYRELADSMKIAYTLNSIGYVYWYLNDYENAGDYFQQSIKISETIDYIFCLARNYNHIGLISWRKQQHNEALKYFQQSMEYAKTINNYDRITAVLNNVGIIKFEQGKLNEALDYFRQSLDMHQNYAHNNWGIIENKNNIAKVYLEQNKLDLAETILKEARDLAIAVKSKVRLNENNELYALLYEKRGQYHKSLNYYKKWIDLKAEILSEQQVKRVAEIESSFELEQKKKEIKLLKVENNLRDAKIRHHKSLLYFLSAILVMSLSGIVLFTILFLKKNAAYKHLVHKNEKILEIEKQRDEYKKKLAEFKETNNIALAEDDSAKYAASALSDQQKEEFAEKLIDLMEKEKLYLDSHLTSASLAEKLGTNRSYLSQVVNTHFGKRFSSFLNEYRIRAAKIKFSKRENQKYTIEYIAHSVGFHSVNAFNKAFKNDTGVTPSFYIKSLEERGS